MTVLAALVGSGDGTVASRLWVRLAAFPRSYDRLLGTEGRRMVATYGLSLTFVIVSASKAYNFAYQGYLAVDLRIYRAAAQAVLAGHNPWPSAGTDVPFAATPPVVIAYLPAALLPETLALVTYAALSVAAAWFLLRTLHLPWWWLLFPPVFESLLVLNPDIFVIALLVAGPRAAAFAVPMKIYAAVPLFLDGRRWSLVGGLVLALLAGPLWLLFLGNLGAVSEKLAYQSLGGLSAWGTWLMIPTALALFALRRRGASWLAVPGLWPYTQLHYSSLALPVAAGSPMLAFLLCFGIPLLPAVAIVLYAAKVVLVGLVTPADAAPEPTDHRRRRQPQPAAATSDGRTAPAPSS